MANKKLLDKATELGIEGAADLSDEELSAKINEVQNQPADAPQGSGEQELTNDDPGHTNTTENLAEGHELPATPRTRELTEDDKAEIVTEFNAPGAQVGAIAEKYQITGEQVFAIVDDANAVKAEQ